ncbi:GNAT family N-acetyltransferase [Allostreptomyces psammosilenae]|uniref:GNAT superfamily N-acetyltransferase n=1 Tax=Allostreptomyces psammosilenae TaxID=1892865 RepID=A0A852ZZW6_9ACTN|nr:GNAT family N-acetyltransferase [Allostreptomyces psammosilenae]NYI07689.1 GNAT superfamily N-acetyltransferase [Allostreptomyces psammosilenae]
MTMPMPPPAIRAAIPEDLLLLPAVEEAADAPFAALGIGPLPPPGGVDELRAARHVLVAGRPPIGFARLEEVDGVAHLEQLSVHADHHRRGVGSALLRAACATAAGEGHRAITLITYRDVPWNAPFYARHGFEPVPEEELTPGLRELRRHEGELGLDRFGARVVMRAVLPG